MRNTSAGTAAVSCEHPVGDECGSSMPLENAFHASPRCLHCDRPTRLTPSLFGVLFALEVFECDLCGLVVTAQAAAKIPQRAARPIRI